ncbi:MAG: hypothetical protein ACP59X_03490 [Solidesulfovibrio sp. DCME]|uniref:hypothetical protein n=1 Tax=Solidesulfovibrio sp. DCME TaxID=3447380 RepID=UPI003D14CB88
MTTARRLSLLDLPSLNMDADIAASMSRIVEASGLSRAEAVDRLNEAARRYGVRLCGGNAEALTLATLEKWLNPNESKNVPSTRALNVFCHAFGSPEPLDLLARSHGQGWRVVGESISIHVANAQGDTVYETSINLLTESVQNWEEYFYAARLWSDVCWVDFPIMARAVVTITISGESPACGNCIVGEVVWLGEPDSVLQLYVWIAVSRTPCNL